jgi:hypothetical protein
MTLAKHSNNQAFKLESISHITQIKLWSFRQQPFQKMKLHHSEFFHFCEVSLVNGN